MHDRASPFAALRLALALTLAVSSGCQDASHGSVDRSASPLCAECTPRAGGETSDFGAACFVDCGKRHPDRTPTPEEESVYMLERVREIERVGLSLPIAWVNWDDTEPPSRTPPSTLNARLEILQPPQIAGSDKCETTLYFPIRVTLETSDGALKASLTGSMYSRGDLLWHGEARVDLPVAFGPIVDYEVRVWQQGACGEKVAGAGRVGLDDKLAAMLREHIDQLRGHGDVGRLLGVLAGHTHLPAAYARRKQQRGSEL